MPVAPAAAAAGIGMQAAATGVGIYAALESGKFNRDMGRYQASLNEQRATRARQLGEIQSDEAAERRRQLVATGKTSFAANGLLLDGGPTDAPALWEQGQAAELAYEQASIRDNAEAEAWGFTSQAAMDRAAAAAAMQAAKLQAWTTGLGGAGQAGLSSYSAFGPKR